MNNAVAEFLDRWCAMIFDDAKPMNLMPLY
jgi:hypothetical protein